MRICMVVITLMDFGGLEEICASLAIALRNRGHATSVLCTTWVPAENQYRQMLKENGVPFVEWPVMRLAGVLTHLFAGLLILVQRKPSGQAFSEARGWVNSKCRGLEWMFAASSWHKPLTGLLLTWWHRRWRPDLLHVHGYTHTSGITFVSDWAQRQGLISIHQEHQTPAPESNWRAEFSNDINKATCVVAVSRESARVLRDMCAITRPIFVANQIVADPLATVGREAITARREFAGVTVTSIARFIEKKGIRCLLEMIAQVKKTCPTVNFRIFGDGPLRADLIRYARELGLNERQIFAGTFRREELGRVMLQTDVFVLSSLTREGLPLTVIEAMAFGRPTVASSVGGISEIIVDGVNGFLCPPGDTACLVQKLSALVEDPAKRMGMGQAARRSYEQGPFQPGSVCEQFVAIYREALKMAHQGARQ
jgi:glycosyltransferase involved in cell wall biosynthesis